MKIIATLACVLLGAVIVKGHRNLPDGPHKDALEECKTEMGFTNDEIEEMHNDPTADKLGCFKACMLEKTEEMKDGKLDFDRIHKSVDEEIKEDDLQKKFHGYIDECTGSVDNVEGRCEVAFAFLGCLVEKGKDDMEE